MTTSYATSKPANPFRRFVALAWNDPDSRSITVGAAGVIIYLLLVWLAGPYVFRIQAVAHGALPRPAPKPFNIELAPDAFTKQPPKPPLPNRFVETNPEAPENTPDETRN